MKQTILIVDDSEANIGILIGLLNQYDIVVATNGTTAIKIANDEKIDLILLDIMMPDIDGYNVCSKLKKGEKTQHIPIIFITAKTDEESIEKAYNVGCADYVSKPFKPKELLARIKTQLDLHSLIANLEFIAGHDNLTGVLNRRKFFQLSKQLFEESTNLYAVMIDIDRFKAINDTHGHGFGDLVIKSIAETITRLMESESIFGRIGGDEFVIVCKIKNNNIESQVERIRLEVDSLKICTLSKKRVKVTISCGIAKKIPSHKDLDQFLKVADDNLYKAKNSGRNKTIFRA